MRSPPHRRRGFTLVELLIGTSLAALAMVALLSGFLFLARNFTRLANILALENSSRTALVYLRADLAQARAVKSGSPATVDSVTLVLTYRTNADHTAYFLEVRRGWIGKPNLEVPDEFWQGTGYSESLRPR